MKLIRKGVFETNSSSSHSISLGMKEAKEFVLDTIYPDQDGVITLTGGEFGWAWDKFNDALTKANYAAADGVDHEILSKVIMDKTGATNVLILASGDYDSGNWSYVDHQSAGTCPRDEEELTDFIFNKNSWLFTGNDNSEASPTFYDVPELQGGKQILPRYKYQLFIEGYDKHTPAKFKSKPDNDKLLSAFHSILQGVYLREDGFFDDDDSIAAQINRNRQNLYEFSDWKFPVDFENGFIYFIKSPWSIAHAQAQNELGRQADNLYERAREIEEELLHAKDSRYVKKVKFHVKEI